MDEKDIKIGMWVHLDTGVPVKVTDLPNSRVWCFRGLGVDGKEWHFVPSAAEPWAPRLDEWLRWKHGEHIARVVEIADRGLRVMRADGTMNLGLCTAEHAEPCLPPKLRDGWYRCSDGHIVHLAGVDAHRWKASALGRVPETWSDEGTRLALATGKIVFWTPRAGEWVQGPVVAAKIVSQPQRENGDWNVQLLDGRTGYWPVINMEPWIPRPGDWVINTEAPGSLPFKVVDVQPGVYTSTKHLFACNYNTEHEETVPPNRRSARVDKCEPCLPPPEVQSSLERSSLERKTRAFTSFGLGLVPVQGRPGIFYDPKYDRTFYSDAMNAVVEGPPKHLELVCRNENAPPTTHMRADGVEVLYDSVRATPQAVETLEKAIAQHTMLDANATCRVCKGPAYLGLGLEPPKCLAPVCGPAKEPEPKCVVQIMHDPHGTPWRAERIWRASRTNEHGELIEGKHPLKERAVAVFRENWKKRRRA